jgi:hypothetical protein
MLVIDSTRAQLTPPRLKSEIPESVRAQVRPDETVRAALPIVVLDGRQQDTRGDARTLVVTSKRLLYFDPRAPQPSLSEIPLASINQVVCTYGKLEGQVVLRGKDLAIAIGSIENDDAAFVDMLIAGISAPDDWP